MIRRLWLALILVPLLAFAACMPESRNSLPEDNRMAPDARLLGTWRAESSTEDFRGEVSQRDDREFLLVTSEAVTTPEFKRIHKVEYHVRAFDLRGRTVLAIAEQDRPADQSPAWRFATYRFEGDDRITVSFMNEDRVRALIQAGQLPGTIRGAGSDFADVVITASPAQLAQLIASSDPAELFGARSGSFLRETK